MRKEVYEMIANNQEEIRWFEDNFNEIEEKYKNKWIAISGNTIIASGKSFGEVWEMAKNKGIKAPFIVEIEPSGWLRNEALRLTAGTAGIAY